MFTLLLLAATAVAEPPKDEALDEFVRLASGPCYDLVQDKLELPAPSDIAARDRLVESFEIEPGISASAFPRLKPRESSLLDGSTVGSIELGDDALIVAFGGKAPGCSVAWLTPSGESHEYEIVEALTQVGWKEPRPGVAVQRGFVGKRMLLRRGEDGSPYLANVLTFMRPGSEMRHVVTLVRIPPHVKLPEGF